MDNNEWTRWRDEQAVYSDPKIHLADERFDEQTRQANFIFNTIPRREFSTPDEYVSFVRAIESVIGKRLYQVRTIDKARRLVIEGTSEFVVARINSLTRSSLTGSDTVSASLIIEAVDAPSFCNSKTPRDFAVNYLDCGISEVLKTRARGGFYFCEDSSSIDLRNLDMSNLFLSNGSSWMFVKTDPLSVFAKSYTMSRMRALEDAFARAWLKIPSGIKKLSAVKVPSLYIPSICLKDCKNTAVKIPLREHIFLISIGGEQ